MKILLWSVIVLVLMSLGARAGAIPPPALASHVQLIGTTVSDLDRSIDFYTGVLGCSEVDRWELHGSEWEQFTGVFGVRMRVALLSLGDELIELTQYLAPEGRPIASDAKANDHSFQHIAIVTSDIQRAYAHLRRHRVRHASTGPQRLPDWNTKAGGIKAFYFKDPDGHTLEIIEFPPEKGDTRWHELAWMQPSELFLGIDHTAIVVGDTERSLAYYRDLLGMEIAGESANCGTEQEHLNNVFGAHLRITTLRARDGGPGIELLEYLQPQTGRLMQHDQQANDIAHWHVRVVASREATSHVSEFTFMWIRLPVDLGFDVGASLKDPDGHRLQIIRVDELGSEN